MTMEIKKMLHLIIVIGLSVLNGKAQTNDKDMPDVYVYFEELMRAEEEVSMFKLERPEYGYDIYVFEIWEPRKRALFNTVDREVYKIVDSVYVKQLDVKPPEWGINIENYATDMNYVSTKYKHIYFVEKIDGNQFKIIEVVSYIGEIFFAPERKKH